MIEAVHGERDVLGRDVVEGHFLGEELRIEPGRDALVLGEFLPIVDHQGMHTVSYEIMVSDTDWAILRATLPMSV